MLTRFFLKRPRLAQVIALVIVITGLLCLPLLPTLEYPEVSPPEVQVSTFYVGATADQVERAVATPIELAINGVDQMMYISSVSSNDGSMKLKVVFEPGTDPDIATLNVQNRIEQAKPYLPKEVLEFGIMTEKQLSTQLMFMSLYSDDPEHDDTWLSNFASLQLKDTLTRIPGVAAINILGKRDYSMRIWLDSRRMQSLGLTPEDIKNAVQDQHRDIIAGKIGYNPSQNHQQLTYTIEANGLLTTPDEFADVILRKGKGGKVLRLGDVARVERGADNYDFVKRLGNSSAIHLSIFQEPGANAIELSQRIRDEIKRLESRFPADINYLIPYDISVFAKETIHELEFTLILTTVLVILVIFLFLTDWRATLIPSVVIPVSLIGSFAVLYILGFSLNTVTLFGLVLAVGIVVDDAIVVVENVQRQMQEEHLPRKEAVIAAMKEVTGPILATTLVLVVIFFPIGFIPGTSGQFYREFGIATSSTVLISAICALTLTPVMCYSLLKPGKQKSIQVSLFVRITSLYLHLIRWLLKHLWVCAFALFGVCTLLYWLFMNSPQAFIPNDDRGFFYISIQLPDSHSLQKTDQVVNKILPVLLEEPGIKTTISTTGMNIVSLTASPSSAFIAVLLQPWYQRTEESQSLNALIQKTQEKLQSFNEAHTVVIPPSAIPAVNLFGGFDFKLQDIYNQSPARLGEVLDEFMAQIHQSPVIEGAYSTYQAKEPRLRIQFDRSKLHNQGVQLSSLHDTLQSYLGSKYINHFYQFGRNYMVYLQADNSLRAQPEDILNLHVTNDKGKTVPLRTLVEIETTFGPSILERYNLYRSASISGNPAPGYSTQDAINTLEAIAENLPEGFTFSWSGLSLQQQETARWTALILLLATLFAYLFLVAQFESWSLPMAVLASIPFSMTGALLSLYLIGMEFNIYAQLGLLILIALAAKNAILIVEFARHCEQDGLSTEAASIKAARLRFRAVMMTSLSFVFGVMPLLFSSGAGALGRKSLGLPVFWGMLSVAVFSTLLTPAFYLMVRKLKTKLVKQQSEE